jgi:hypothetical protein
LFGDVELDDDVFYGLEEKVFTIIYRVYPQISFQTFMSCMRQPPPLPRSNGTVGKRL